MSLEASESAFASDLQLDWILADLRITGANTTIVRVVAHSPAPERRDVVGSMGLAALFEPLMQTVSVEAAFDFGVCYYVRLAEEFANTVLPSGGDAVGQTFRHITGTSVLDALKAAAIGPGPLVHYQFVFPDQVLDIVAVQAPRVTLWHRT